MKEAMKLALEGAANYIDTLGGDSRKYRQALANEALDKKAENARELGLDYEPVLKDNSNYRYDPPVAEPVAWVCYGAPGKRDIDFEEAGINKLPIGTLLYTTPPAAPDLQAELVKANSQAEHFEREWYLRGDELEATNRQVEILSDALAESRREVAAQPAPVQATMKLESSGPGHGPAPNQKLSVRHVSLIDEGKTPPVQPAVPDAIGPNEDELPAYAAGWNDCRAEMLRGMKP